MDVEVHIDEIVLYGLPAAARRRIADAVTAELERLVREQGLPAWMTAGENVLSVEGGAFTVEPGARAERIGAQIAQAIYGGQGQ